MNDRFKWAAIAAANCYGVTYQSLAGTRDMQDRPLKNATGKARNRMRDTEVRVELERERFICSVRRRSASWDPQPLVGQ